LQAGSAVVPEATPGPEAPMKAATRIGHSERTPAFSVNALLPYPARGDARR